MLPPAGSSAAEQWVAAGRSAAAQDLIQRLSKIENAGPIYLLAAEESDRHRFASAGVTLINPRVEPFHFGQVLANFVEESGCQTLAYFGGGSAPLLSLEQLEENFDLIRPSNEPLAIVNNYHSTDWVLLNQAQSLRDVADRLPQDNPLGWVLDHEAAYRVEALLPSAGSRLDIDTPADLLMLHAHPTLGPALHTFFSEQPVDKLRTVHQISEVMRTPASTLALIGRSSSHLWQALEQQLQIWIRVFVEERGMVASGRMARGEVKSLIGQIVDGWGAQGFVDRLGEMTDAVLWDSRVWMAQRGTWSSAAERFALDLGWVDQVHNEPLRALTLAMESASVPILSGGHGVVSGGLLAILESLRPG
jgi:hypothetical protein